MKNALLSAVSMLALIGTHQAIAQQAPPDREAFHAALQECATENNVTLPERGERPSATDRQVIDSCLQNKGFSPPPPGRGGHHRGAHDGHTMDHQRSNESEPQQSVSQ